MNQLIRVVIAVGLIFGAAQAVTETDTFPATGPELTWTSSYEDDQGAGLTDMTVTSFSSPSGDNSVGMVTPNVSELGGLGMAHTGATTLTNYSVEAQVYVELEAGYYTGIFMRLVQTETTAESYQLVANFGLLGPTPVAMVKFRHWNQSASGITTLAEWDAADLPGGAPTTDGWHKLKISATGNDFMCYWDDQLLGTGAIQDTTASPIAAGNYGVYVWDGMAATPASIKVDDMVMEELTVSHVADGTTGLPTASSLAQNYPNPFNPSTTIEFTIEKTNNVALNIYNIQGELVRSLINGQLQPNSYSYSWDGRDTAGASVSSGVYIYTLINGAERQSKRMILLK
jgi:hypothetical protein